MTLWLLFFVPFVGITCQHGSPCCGAVGFSWKGGELEAACESGKKRLKGKVEVLLRQSVFGFSLMGA